MHNKNIARFCSVHHTHFAIPQKHTMLLARTRFYFNGNLAVLQAKTGAAKAACKASALPSLTLGRKVSSAPRGGVLGALTRASAPKLDKTRQFSTVAALYQQSSVHIIKTRKADPEEGESKAPRKWPVNSSKWAGYWLVASAVSVFGIVVLGGLTRLTESGLSITEWKPVTGSLPPMSEADWIEEFDKYKNSPEFKLLNSNITLSEFKFIFWMEWAHRLWGRFIGLTFVLPAVYFVARKRVSPNIAGRLGVISLLVGLQGAIGWWMVKSGLDSKFMETDNAHPRVSPYRLATHLGAAFVLYWAMLSTGLQVLRESRWIANPTAAVAEFSKLNNPILKPFQRYTSVFCGLVFLTAMSGAFVAGLDAGMIYNTFPFMGEGIMPPKTELMDPLFAQKVDKSDLWWRNIFENPVTVQFDHRVLATTTFCASFALLLMSNRFKPFLPRKAFLACHSIMGIAMVQVTLGISTLLYLVPTPLAAAHQAGALALLSAAAYLGAQLKRPRVPFQNVVSRLHNAHVVKSGLQDVAKNQVKRKTAKLPDSL